jgi:AcrR family transcriptional regulator
MYARTQVYSSEPETSRLSEHKRASKSRAYTMRARLESVEQTRQRITEATMRLHEEVGPAATTVSAIAELAGVTRLTVYRHFPDDDDLIAACSAHWRALHPRPDVRDWGKVVDPVERVRVALGETYRWARGAAPMLSMIYRDLDQLPAFVAGALDEDERTRVRVLARGFHVRGRASRRLETVLAHALDVRTWQSLCGDGGLRDGEAVDLVTGLVVAAAVGWPPPP